MTNSVTVRTVKTIIATADAFIVPNKASRPVDYLISESIIENTKRICNANMLPYSEDEHLVDIWFTSKALNTENLTDHGGSFKGENGTTYSITCPFHLIPESLLANKNEGETCTIYLPARILPRGGCQVDYEEVVLQLEVTLNQKAYRYRRFGNFERVFEDVIGA